jgi:glycerol-3-phosphate cytidylyltransferase
VSEIKRKTIITFGTFDVFHAGHLQILQRAASLGQVLIVGVSTDQLSYEKKARPTVYSEKERLAIVSAIRHVDHVFLEESLEKKSDYIKEYQADILVMGDDWRGKFDIFSNLCEVVYFPRTPAISTTELIERIQLDF